MERHTYLGALFFFKVKILRTIAVLFVTMAFSCPNVFALNPPGIPEDALWWGTWAKAHLSQKIINYGDVVKLTLDIVGGPAHGFYCNTGAWRMHGTRRVIAYNPNSICFQILDYSPKTDDLHTVIVDPDRVWVEWTARADPAPATDPTGYAHCYCKYDGIGTSSDTTGCPSNFWQHGTYGPGDSFTVTLKATCSRVDDYWSMPPELAHFWGDWGLDWNYGAQDYYKFGGDARVSLTANPQTLPADGSISALSARVYELNSGFNLPHQNVDFSMLFGILNPASAMTDENGIARASLSSPGVEGNDIVQATAGNRYDRITVSFTHADKPPVNQKSNFGNGDGRSLIAEPVHAGLGNYVTSKPLFSFPGRLLPFTFSANYNSLDNIYNGPLGYGWTHTYNIRLTLPTPPSTDVTIKWGDGHEETFHGDGSGNFTPINCNTPVILTMLDASHYLATLHDKTAYQFDSGGRLLAISDLNGNQIALTYSTTTPNLIDHITDTAGREIAFTYDVSGHLTAITSPLKPGNTVSFQYDGLGNLTGIVDPRGKTWGFGYDSSHRILTVVNAKGLTILTNSYDASGRVMQQMDGAGNNTSYQYTVDANGTTTRVSPPSGNAITHTYDLAYNLTSVTDGEGRQASSYTDSQGRLVSMIDKNGGNVQMLYDANNNPNLASDRSGATAQFSFNAQNRPTSITGPLGYTTASFGYDANGNLTSMQNALGSGQSISVNPSGQPTTIKDFDGKDWSFAYNASGLPQTMTDPTGAQISLAYNAAGQPTQVSFPVSGITFQMTYDEVGYVLTRTDPLGYVSRLTYDDNGNLATRTFVPTGATATYTYDWADRPTQMTNALGGITTYSYDVDGNLVSVTDADGVTIMRQYDKSNRLTAVVDALGHHVYYGYDSNGNVTSVKNEIGDTWSTTFDAEGRPLQTTDPLGNKRTTAYDIAGRVTSVTDPLGNTQTFQYDKVDRVISTTLPDQGVVQYSYYYSYTGRLAGITDPLGHSWSFSYDNTGRLSSKNDPNGKVENYIYDGMGRFTKKTLRDATVITYAYDADSRLTSIALPGQTITYVYDAAGNLARVTDASGTTTMTYDLLGRRLTRTDPSGKVMAYSYTAAGRLATMTYPGGNVLSYAYDTGGRLITITDWRGNHTTFQYDSLNRVTQVNLPNGTRTLYTYDAAGRVVTRVNQKADATVIASYSYTYTLAGQIATVQGSQPVTGNPAPQASSYSFDPINRMLRANVNGALTTYTFDDRGNLISKASGSATTNYIYDALNRLVSVADGTNTTTYSYDGSGNRLTKTHNGTTTRYVREGGAIYCTLDGAGTVQAYNVFAGTLLYSLDSSGAVKVYHADERGSVVAITDASQDVVQSYSYDPYGKVLGSSGSLNNAFQYVGRHGVMADENGLYHMQARYYDPDVRRFVTEDPLGLAAGLNLYGYVGGDPVNKTDPRGLDVRSGVFYPKVVDPIDIITIKPPSEDIYGWNGKVFDSPTYNVTRQGVTYVTETHPEAFSRASELVYGEQVSGAWPALPEFNANIEYSSSQSKALVLVEETPKEVALFKGHPYNFDDPRELEKIVPKGGKVKVLATETVAERGVGAIEKDIAVKGGAVCEGRGAALVEAGGYFVMGLMAFDWYMNQGKVWDSYDNKMITWGEYKEKYLWSHVPPKIRSTVNTGMQYIGKGLNLITEVGPNTHMVNYALKQAEAFGDGSWHPTLLNR